jgi:hypothetical protein
LGWKGAKIGKGRRRYMKRTFIGLFIILMTVAALTAGCRSESGGFTPPIATPNQNLPLYESGGTAGGQTGDVQAAPSDTGSGAAKALIKAEPDIIHKYGASGGYDSKITVEDGSFAPNSVVTVWGETTDTDDVESPPWIYEKDIDSSKDDIQLMTDENGGLEFWVRAGTSTGFFTINVGGSSASGTSGKAGKKDGFDSTTDVFSNLKKSTIHDSFATVLSVTITITE